MPASTLRAWVLGLFFAIVVSGVDQFFHFRYPAVNIYQVCSSAVICVPHVAESGPLCKIKYVPLLVSFPMGKLWARYVPNVSIFGISLNPGPFNVKEHVIITTMANVGAGPAYVVSVTSLCHIISARSNQFIQTNVIGVQRVFYNQHRSFACQFYVWSRQSL